MINTQDIKEKIAADFGDKATEVYALFAAALRKTDYLNNDRKIRCILFLVKKDLAQVSHYISAAKEDPRDVMLWAEYANYGQDKNPTLVRNFENPFGQADYPLNVR